MPSRDNQRESPALREVVIREFQPGDEAALRQCVVALQEFERAIDEKLPPGEAMADAYCDHIHLRCREANGRVFVAERAGEVIGFVSVLAREPFTEPDDPIGTYALIADLSVLPAHRGLGIGARLVARAEAFAKAAGARELRVYVLARNEAARSLYRSKGFEPYLEIFRRALSDADEQFHS